MNDRHHPQCTCGSIDCHFCNARLYASVELELYGKGEPKPISELRESYEHLFREGERSDG